MRDAVYKILPLAFGSVLGWMIFNPPAWLDALGPMSWLVNIGLVALLLLTSIPLIVLANVPNEPRLDVLGMNDVPASMAEIERQLEALRFHRVGPPVCVNTAPSALLIGFVHDKEPVYATVFHTGTEPARTGSDFVSILHGERGGLTTNADPNGAVLPAGPGAFRQVLPGSTLQQQFQAHVDGLAYLRAQGIQARSISEGTFRQDFMESMRRQRACFLAAPLRNSMITLWRAATHQVPFAGKLADQSIARRQLRELQTGTT